MWVEAHLAFTAAYFALTACFTLAYAVCFPFCLIGFELFSQEITVMDYIFHLYSARQV